MNKYVERIYNGVAKENPTFVLMLGMCPTLAVSTAAINGLGMGIGFTLALTALGFIRELLGAGTGFGIRILPESFEPIGIFIKAPGAFLVLAIMIMVLNAIGVKNRSDELVNGCDGCCANCAKGPVHGKEETK